MSGFATVVVALAASAGAVEPELVVARNGKTDAIVVVSPDAGLPETKSPGGQAFAQDVKHYRNKARLYVNGQEVARRDFPAMWWHADYRFEWDVDLVGKLRAGRNTLALVANCEHHFGGMFRRPFLHAPASK